MSTVLRAYFGSVSSSWAIPVQSLSEYFASISICRVFESGVIVSIGRLLCFDVFAAIK